VSGTWTGPGASAKVEREGIPEWLVPVRDVAERIEPTQLSRFLPPEQGGRRSAVLVLFGEQPQPGSGPDLLLIERARRLRSHAGQPSFPGGALDPEDGDPAGEGRIRAALREAWEETGLDPSGVQVFGVLPDLYIPVSDFVVTPVLGWWHTPVPVAPVDEGEVAEVFRVPVARLVDPANRARLRHPSGFRGPAFRIDGHVIWGFTAGVIDRLLHHAGWERPWDNGQEVELGDASLFASPEEQARARALEQGTPLGGH
jgi:8-oxo-dGTP pyrophosphatase MutT (NUDIX family)